MKANWQATGWRGSTVLCYSLWLSAGVSADVRRNSLNAPWSFMTSGMAHRSGRYKVRTNAQRAAEDHLKRELRAVLRSLRSAGTVF